MKVEVKFVLDIDIENVLHNTKALKEWQVIHNKIKDILSIISVEAFKNANAEGLIRKALIDENYIFDVSGNEDFFKNDSKVFRKDDSLPSNIIKIDFTPKND